ncbi:hypothetical protein ZYGR_0AI05600 [Zygosaccharomyces rouxii]|uniref:Man(5)GlcNAc(2)-PP-dolichol translocation protein RFT1 n=1 Tax=Zygosaccharomyces rouxii TaxID=4956 RepID=A0A1Q3ABX4_ZYGRO|nr:hypothetical protein ZYGR_0AI05600 [Zygosaccharomyces rouxii]
MEKKRNTVSSGQQMLEKSTKGATFLMMGQLITKMTTFVLNSLLVRFLSPRIFGITAFLEFILGTALFFSREAVRMSTLRIKDSNEDEKGRSRSTVLQTAVNFAHIPIWIGFPLSIILTTWQYRNINSYFVTLPYFTWSMFLIWSSIIIELLSEPFFIANQFMLNYGTRSQFESISVTFGSVVNFLVIMGFEKWSKGSNIEVAEPTKEGIAILAFALGKVSHSLVLLACYYYNYRRWFAPQRLFSIRLVKIYPPYEKKGYYFQEEISQHFRKVYSQLCFKHLLAEGDKLIINSLCTVEEQGIYSLLSNYGSLLTRLLFAPIEESLRLFLARLLSSGDSKNLKLSMQVLKNLTKFYLYLSLMIIIFGPTNSSFLLQFLVGSKWSTTSVLDTIRVYCFYLPFLALNGIFEAFFQSIATGDQILMHSYFMMTFLGVFLLTSWALIKYLELSIEGLIISNVINMSLRMIYCGLFIQKVSKGLRAGSSSFALRNFKSVLLLGIAIWILDWGMIGLVKNFRQFFINLLLAVVMLTVILLKEKDSVMKVLGGRFSRAKRV